MLKLFRKYQARNTRHLVYIRYQRNSCPAKKLKASAKALRVLEKIAHGYSYREIAMMLDVSKSCIEKHINKLLFDNQCNHANELVTMFADWEYNNG